MRGYWRFLSRFDAVEEVGGGEAGQRQRRERGERGERGAGFARVHPLIVPVLDQPRDGGGRHGYSAG